MLFAVIQEELKDLNPAELGEVYSQVFGLNKFDAVTKIQNQSPGIIAFGLEEDKAALMVEKLSELKYSCRKQSIDSLLPIHDSLAVHSALFCEDGIFFENLFGEKKRILWNHLQMIEVYRIHNKSVSLQNRKKAKRVGKPSTVTIKKEAIKEGKFIEVYSDSPFPRLLIDASRFNYSCLGDEMDSDSQCNFEKLLANVKSLCQKFNISFTDTSNYRTYPDLKSFEKYSHWKLQQLDSTH